MITYNIYKLLKEELKERLQRSCYKDVRAGDT